MCHSYKRPPPPLLRGLRDVTTLGAEEEGTAMGVAATMAGGEARYGRRGGGELGPEEQGSDTNCKDRWTKRGG